MGSKKKLHKIESVLEMKRPVIPELLSLDQHNISESCNGSSEIECFAGISKK